VKLNGGKKLENSGYSDSFISLWYHDHYVRVPPIFGNGITEEEIKAKFDKFWEMFEGYNYYWCDKIIDGGLNITYPIVTNGAYVGCNGNFQVVDGHAYGIIPTNQIIKFGEIHPVIGSSHNYDYQMMETGENDLKTSFIFK